MKGISRGGGQGLSANNVWGKRGVVQRFFVLDNRVALERGKQPRGVSPDFIRLGFFSWST